MNKLITLLLVATLFNLNAESKQQPTKEFPVIAYTMQNKSKEIRYHLITDVIFCFLKPLKTGVVIDPFDATWLKNEVTKAHKHNVKVHLAVGGWQGGNDSNFETLANSKPTRTVFINELLKLVEKYKIDGIDMDWEYPDKGQSSRNFTALMNELSSKLKEKGKTLSMAVVERGAKGDAVDQTVFKVVDRIHVMTYDGGRSHGSMQQAVNGINYWIKRGVPQHKLIIGVPFYSRGKKVMTYENIVKENPDARNLDHYNGMIYNGIPTIKKKVKLAKARCGGIMFWQLMGDSSDDKFSLLKAMNDLLNPKPSK